LADLLRSGVPLLRSIAVIRDQATHAGLKQVMTDLHEQVSQGRTLSEGMARHPRVFSEMAVSVVRAGSEGGFLEEALDRIADFTEQQQDLKGRVLGAITYPLFLMSVGMIVVTVLLVYVVPKFAPLFDRMRSQGGLPRITDWLLGFSKFLSTWWWALAIVLGVIGAFIYMRISTPEGRMWVDRAKLHMPVAGRIFLNFSVARFCRVLGTLLKNGVPILRSGHAAAHLPSIPAGRGGDDRRGGRSQLARYRAGRDRRRPGPPHLAAIGSARTPVRAGNAAVDRRHRADAGHRALGPRAANEHHDQVGDGRR
jgi:general secretion pathway protein F/type IV pilus assembly protein PilC